MLPVLHDIFALTVSCFEKVNTEANRVGLLKRKLQFPEASVYTTVSELVNQIYVVFQVCARVFRMILGFAKRYINDSYSVSLYLNMNRIVRAENELNEVIFESKTLLKEVNFLRLQNACYAAYSGVVWLR